MKWFSRRTAEPNVQPAVLLVSLDGFFSAGATPSMLDAQLKSREHEVVYQLNIDDYYDYRARRPAMKFNRDHYAELSEPTLDICETTDVFGRRLLFLTGPEPDFRWEQFAAELIDAIEELHVSLVVFLGAVPMGVPHTRPTVITHHATRPELVERPNIWDAEIVIPASASSFAEYRLGQHGFDAIGYVAHVPHYLAQVEYPTATIALLEALSLQTDLEFDLGELRRLQASALAQIEKQIAEQDGAALLSELEGQYDAYTRGAGPALLGEGEPIPSGDELASQFEQFLAARDRDED